MVRRGPRGLGQVFGKHFAAQGYPYKVTVLVHRPWGGEFLSFNQRF